MIIVLALHRATPQLYSCIDFIWYLHTTFFFLGKTLGSSDCCLLTCFVDSACQCRCLSKAERPPSATVQTEVIYQAVSHLRPGGLYDWRREN